MEVASDALTFVNPMLYALRRALGDSAAFHYKTVLVRPDGKRLAQVMEEVLYLCLALFC